MKINMPCLSRRTLRLILTLCGSCLLCGFASGQQPPGKSGQPASAYLKGSGQDRATAIVTDGAGGVFVAGYTTAAEPPAKGGGLVISKFSRDLKSVEAMARLAGTSKRDRITALAVDKSGDVILAGFTDSANFPATPGAYQPKPAGGQDIFVAKFNRDLSKITAATLLGGKQNDLAYGLALDANGNIYVAGRSGSADYPISAGAYAKNFKGGSSDIVVTKLDNGLSKLLASTFIGGTDTYWPGAADVAYAIALDGAGNVIVAGYTESSDYPTTPGAYKNPAVTLKLPGMVVSKLDGNLGALLASCVVETYAESYARSVGCDQQGNVIVGGCTRAFNYPFVGSAFNPNWRDKPLAIVSKFDADLKKLTHSFCLGVSVGEDPTGVAGLRTDSSGTLYAAGAARAPFTPIGASNAPAYNGNGGSFVAKLDANLQPTGSAFLDGAGAEQCRCLALDTDGSLVTAGWSAFFAARVSGSDLQPVNITPKDLLAAADRNTPDKTRWQDTILVANFDTPYPVDTSCAGGNNWSMGSCLWKRDGNNGWMEFNAGGNDYLRIPDSASLHPAQLSVALWFRLPPASADGRYPFLYSKGGTGGKDAPRRDWGMYTASQKGKWLANCEYPYVPPGGVTGTNKLPEVKVGPVEITPDVWHHAAVTYDGKCLSLYLDGTLTTNRQEAGTLTNTPNQLLIGRRAGDNHEVGRFQGAMDNIRIYKTALSAEEVKTLFKLGRNME